MVLKKIDFGDTTLRDPVQSEIHGLNFARLGLSRIEHRLQP
jgi:hypothetical protein